MGEGRAVEGTITLRVARAGRGRGERGRGGIHTAARFNNRWVSARALGRVPPLAAPGAPMPLPAGLVWLFAGGADALRSKCWRCRGVAALLGAGLPRFEERANWQAIGCQAARHAGATLQLEAQGGSSAAARSSLHAAHCTPAPIRRAQPFSVALPPAAPVDERRAPGCNRPGNGSTSPALPGDGSSKLPVPCPLSPVPWPLAPGTRPPAWAWPKPGRRRAGPGH
jgi:hypothetical protein